MTNIREKKKYSNDILRLFKKKKMYGGAETSIRIKCGEIKEFQSSRATIRSALGPYLLAYYGQLNIRNPN